MLLETKNEFQWYHEAKDLPNCERARDYARTKWAKAEDYEFVVIKVEGYNCIAKLLGDSNWYISDYVFPFDDDKIYPMQEIERKIYFKTY